MERGGLGDNSHLTAAAVKQVGRILYVAKAAPATAVRLLFIPDPPRSTSFHAGLFSSTAAAVGYRAASFSSDF